MTTPPARRYLLPLLIAIAMGLSAALISCGADSSGGETSGEGAVAETDVIAIGDDAYISARTRPNAVYEYDIFIEAGWKQHEIYDIATLPEAESARYGFYNRRDVEIRLYPDHATALDAGAASAEEAIDRTVHDGSGFASRRVYGAYLVAGNTVMLCEVQVEDCLALLEAVEARP